MKSRDRRPAPSGGDFAQPITNRPRWQRVPPYSCQMLRLHQSLAASKTPALACSLAIARIQAPPTWERVSGYTSVAPCLPASDSNTCSREVDILLVDGVNPLDDIGVSFCPRRVELRLAWKKGQYCFRFDPCCQAATAVNWPIDIVHLTSLSSPLPNYLTWEGRDHLIVVVVVQWLLLQRCKRWQHQTNCVRTGTNCPSGLYMCAKTTSLIISSCTSSFLLLLLLALSTDDSLCDHGQLAR